MKYYEIIKNSREDKDFKQYEFANEIGLSPKTYSMYENGLRFMSFETLDKIAFKLNLSFDYILSLSMDRNYEKIRHINLNKIGERLKKIRLSKKYSQAKMAALIGCNQQTLSEYERNNLIIPLDTLEIFCKVNSVSADYITGRLIRKPNL